MRRDKFPGSIAFLVLFQLVCGSANGQQPPPSEVPGPVQTDDFSFKPPDDVSHLDKKSVWFTAYIDFLVDENTSKTSVPLKDASERPFHIGLSRISWCKAANEGTITVLLANHQSRSFNFAGQGSRPITDCTDILSGFKPKQIVPINKSLFSELPSDASFGLGAKAPDSSSKFRLVPGRSIAIDLSDEGMFRLGEVLYIPQLKKVTVKLPDGRTVQHDGYVMAVDKVSACSGAKDMPEDCNINHLDYFKGRSRSDALPEPLASDPGHPLDAYIVSDAAVIAKLKTAHSRD
jgi:hypothetical protein